MGCGGMGGGGIGVRAGMGGMVGNGARGLRLTLHNCCLPQTQTLCRKDSGGSSNSGQCCCARLSKKQEIMDDHDDVDAPSRSRASSTAQLVDIAFKLAFLKILLLDIGISLGDTVTDFLQGFNLILDFPTSTVRWSSLPYGLAILLASWLPLPIALLHLGFSEELGL